MKTDAEIEQLLRQNRPTTTPELDERILADALAAMHQSAVEHQSKPVSTATDFVAAPTGQSAVFSLRTLARGLRRHLNQKLRRSG